MTKTTNPMSKVDQKTKKTKIKVFRKVESVLRRVSPSSQLNDLDSDSLILIYILRL